MFVSKYSMSLVIEAKDREIERLIIENKELRDRLFVKNSLPVSGQELVSEKGESHKTYKTKRERLKEFIHGPQLIAPSLSPEELEHLNNVAQ